MASKLIMVEGLPGSGKSSTAKHITEYLKARGVSCTLYPEGDLSHPADFESVAYLAPGEFQELILEFPQYEEVLREAQKPFTSKDAVLLPYGKLAREAVLPQELLDAMSRRDVYELPPDEFCEVISESWRNFAKTEAQLDTVVVFECCFLQNNITQLFVHHDQSEESVLRHMRHLSQIIGQLNPRLIYLNPLSAKDRIEKVRHERPSRWLDFVVWYHTEQGYGKRMGLSGVDGYIEVLEQRKSLELSVLESLPMSHLTIDNPQEDWGSALRTIETYISES